MAVVAETVRNEFSMAVEKKAVNESISFMTALVAVLDECHIEPERASKYINKSLKSKIEAEAIDLRMLKGRTKGANIFEVF